METGGHRDYNRDGLGGNWSVLNKNNVYIQTTR